jgi:hypothetical protein
MDRKRLIAALTALAARVGLLRVRCSALESNAHSARLLDSVVQLLQVRPLGERIDGPPLWCKR